ncbi:MAG: sugar phosphate isomerase/epimerase family protein [Halosimplex sp.]
MTYFAMDTAFRHSLGTYPLRTRCEMLAELGYDATYLTLFEESDWDDARRVGTVAREHDLDVAAVYGGLDVSAPPDDAENRRFLDLVGDLEGVRGVEVPLSASADGVANSDPAADDDAVAWLERLLEAAGDDLLVSLYPHVGNWLERVEDAARLCDRVDDPRLGAVFCGYHWYAVDGEAPDESLRAAAPHLQSANLCGSSRRDGQATIEPLDTGELDNFVLLGLLRSVGYDGPVGIQGYSVGGDAYANLRRSLAALEDVDRRVDEHPEWADIRFG